ncbi:MAG: hypothetical protein WDN28_17005 [Chthoniobacter sp.]
MSTTEIILTEKIEHLGAEADVVRLSAATPAIFSFPAVSPSR